MPSQTTSSSPPPKRQKRSKNSIWSDSATTSIRDRGEPSTEPTESTATTDILPVVKKAKQAIVFF